MRVELTKYRVKEGKANWSMNGLNICTIIWMTSSEPRGREDVRRNNF